VLSYLQGGNRRRIRATEIAVKTSGGLPGPSLQHTLDGFAAGTVPLGLAAEALGTGSEQRLVVDALSELRVSAKDYGAIGTNTSAPLSSTWLSGAGIYGSIYRARENRWTGYKRVVKNSAIAFDPLAGSGEIYLKVGADSCHFNFNTSTGAISVVSGYTLPSTWSLYGSAARLSGTTGTANKLNISAFNSTIWVEEQRYADGTISDVIWSEFTSAYETDEVAAQHAIVVASIRATQLGGRCRATIPPGTHLFSRPLFLWPNVEVDNQGELKLVGGNTRGGFVYAQAASNVHFHGGIINSNSQGNDNSFCVGNVGFGGQIVGVASQDVLLTDTYICNAKHFSLVAEAAVPGTGATDIAYVGAGGGKGIVAQLGAGRFIVSNVTVRNCAWGIDLEGTEATDASFGQSGAAPILISNVTVNGSKYGALLVQGQYNTASKYSTTGFAQLTNVVFDECASGYDGFGSANGGLGNRICDNFGVITNQTAINVTYRNVAVRNTTGRITVIRGSMRLCDLDITATAPEFNHYIDSRAYGGYNPQSSPSRHIEGRIGFRLMGPPANAVGYLFANDNTNNLDFSFLTVTGLYIDASSSPVLGYWPGARLCEHQSSSTTYDFLNLADGTRTYCSGGYVPNPATGADYVINGLGIDDNAGATNVRLVARSGRKIAMAINDGSAGIVCAAVTPANDGDTVMELRVKKGGVVSVVPVVLSADSGGRMNLQVVT
jgi:hypothetical protein